MKKLTRLLYLINYLSRRYSASVVDLATVCGVSKRTIFRDIQDIHQAGFPIYYHRGYRVLRPRSMLPGDYTLDEIRALLGVLAAHKDLPLALSEGVLRRIQGRMKGAAPEFGRFRIIASSKTSATRCEV